MKWPQQRHNPGRFAEIILLIQKTFAGCAATPKSRRFSKLFHEIQFTLERQLMTLLPFSIEAGQLVYRAKVKITGARYEFLVFAATWFWLTKS
jgi:hypothetical protein